MATSAIGRIWSSAFEHVPGSEAVSFGRHAGCQVPVGHDPADTAVSRRAGEFRPERGGWMVSNTGSRAIFIVEAGREIELVPAGRGRSQAALHGGYGWIRLPGTQGDHAVEFELPGPGSERASSWLERGAEPTDVESVVSITDNERRSVVAVYELYLQLPPHYRREPRSFRAAAARLGVEEGKVKADLRRVQSKVTAAAGSDIAGNRSRDVLFEWLCGHGVIGHRDRGLLS